MGVVIYSRVSVPLVICMLEKEQNSGGEFKQTVRLTMFHVSSRRGRRFTSPWCVNSSEARGRSLASTDAFAQMRHRSIPRT